MLIIWFGGEICQLSIMSFTYPGGLMSVSIESVQYHVTLRVHSRRYSISGFLDSLTIYVCSHSISR